jgi:hypothetical protein
MPWNRTRDRVKGGGFLSSEASRKPGGLRVRCAALRRTSGRAGGGHERASGTGPPQRPAAGISLVAGRCVSGLGVLGLREEPQVVGTKRPLSYEHPDAPVLPGLDALGEADEAAPDLVQIPNREHSLNLGHTEARQVGLDGLVLEALDVEAAIPDVSLLTRR